jgi:hypothetical protein
MVVVVLSIWWWPELASFMALLPLQYTNFTPDR